LIGAVSGLDSMVTITEYRKKGDKVSSSEWNVFIDNFKEIEERLSFQEKRIQYGVIENIDTSKIGIQSGNVAFSYPFSKIPIVILTLENLDGGIQLKTAWVSNRSVDGFTWNIFILVSKPKTTCNILWVAIE
jgi:hypothetical protein